MMHRRTLLIAMAGGVLGSGAGAWLKPSRGTAAPFVRAPGGKSTVALVKGADRATGIRRAVELLKVNPVRGKKVLIKPNFNTADPFPASTHNDTLKHLIVQLRQMGAGDIVIGERSGPPDTGGVMRDKGVLALCERLGVRLINFEELPPEDWVRVRPEGSHWSDGFDVPRPVLEAERVVSTCCLKTHGYGGVFTMSLKLSVGLTHKRHMGELHTSFRSMRKMIAEINQAYTPALIVMDGLEAFTDGGPSRGTRKQPKVIVAGTDRIAVDAVGLAILKALGSNRDIMERPIFAQEQIARAAELGLGVTGPDQIALVSDDPVGLRYVEKLNGILAREVTA
ncbi:MAG TPA: DUF362 domain-containing protein [bacterium]|nr:DUF362 domain-containing protein [bacterium]